MSEAEKKVRSPKKIATYVILGLLAAGAIPWIALKLYLPIYLAWFQPDPDPSYAQYVEGMDGIFYVARVNDGLYRGSKPDKGLAGLKRLGIKTCINLRTQESGDYGAEARALGLDYYWMPVSVTKGPSQKQVDDFLRIVNDPAAQPVYFHCTVGIDRTGLLAGIYRIEHDGWTNEQAKKEMDYFGHAPIWHDIGELMDTYPDGFQH